MIQKYFLAIFLFISSLSHAQVLGPPPPGCDVDFAIDADNDGTAVFDIDYYLNTHIRNLALAEHNYDLSGYTLEFYYYSDLGEEITVSGPTFTNFFNGQQCYFRFNFIGGGPEYNAADLQLYYGCVDLYAIEFDGDFDTDGVPNGIEDSNGNLNLIDEDTDNDGIYNFLDNDDDNDGVPTVNEDANGNGDFLDDDANANGVPDYLDPELPLKVQTYQDTGFGIFPNPATGSVTADFGSDAVADFTIKIYSASGQTVKISNVSKTLDISDLTSGIYYIELTAGDRHTFKKLVIL